MRILTFSSYYGISGGGAGIYLQQITNRFLQFGLQPIIIGIQEPWQLEVTKEMDAKFIQPWHIYPLHKKDKQPAWKKILWQLWDLYNPYAAKLIKKIIQEQKPDLVHIHKMRGFSGAIWHVCADLMPGKIIQTLQDYESISPIGTLEGRIGHWAKQGNWMLWPYQTVRHFQTREIVHVTAPSRYTLDTVLARGLFANARRSVISNPHSWTLEQLIARQNTHVDHIKKPDRPITFFFLGRLEPEKGIRELLIAFSNIAEKYKNIRLHVAGWGTLSDELKQIWEKHSSIKFVGSVEGKQKEQLLEGMDVMVVPSTWPEVFGIVTVEALAFGKPVIASNTGGLPEIITNGQTGWLFEPGNTQDLQDKMEYVTQHSQILDEMTEACYEAAKKYAVDVIAQEYLSLYEKVIRDGS